MSNESIGAVFLGNFALLVGKEMICVLEKKDGWMEGGEEEKCVRQKRRERESKFVFVFFS